MSADFSVRVHVIPTITFRLNRRCAQTERFLITVAMTKQASARFMLLDAIRTSAKRVWSRTLALRADDADWRKKRGITTERKGNKTEEG